ncbi:hypothetical protein Hanom_Chr12g01080991 [Helianthus anomalus]
MIKVEKKKDCILPQDSNLDVQLFDCVCSLQPHMITWPVYQQQEVVEILSETTICQIEIEDKADIHDSRLSIIYKRMNY